jgi:hypothetical protein
MREVTTVTFDNKKEAMDFFSEGLDTFINFLEDKIKYRNNKKEKILFKLFTSVYDRLSENKLHDIVSDKLLREDVKRQVKNRNEKFFIENFNIFNKHLKDEHLEFLKVMWLNEDSKGFNDKERKDLWVLFDKIIFSLEFISQN